jgi:hypothetical protein
MKFSVKLVKSTNFETPSLNFAVPSALIWLFLLNVKFECRYKFLLLAILLIKEDINNKFTRNSNLKLSNSSNLKDLRLILLLLYHLFGYT